MVAIGKKYRARIVENGEKVHLGMYDTPEEAAKAFELHGEKAILNFPNSQS